MVPLRRIGCITVLLLAGAEAGPIAAQGAAARIPKRPKLAAERDSNSALDYFTLGSTVLERDPDKAADAFYWASRLDPTWAAPLYGQYAASLLAQPPSVLNVYLTRRERAMRNPTLRYLDSLAYQALLKNPFVDRRLDGVILATWLYRQTGGDTELRDLGIRDRRFAGWAAYARGDYKEATSIFVIAIKQYPRDPDLHLWRALAFFSLGMMDSARTAVRSALALELREEDQLPGFGWVSHAFAEYSIGFLYELGEQRDSAGAAYERALVEEITFHPAHRQLARIRLAAHDTAGALAEYVQAAGIAPGDAGYLYELGMLLMTTGRTDSAATVLLQATAAEPWYALPHFPLGLLYQRSGFDKEAADHFGAFMRLAPRAMAPAIAVARDRLAALSAKSAGP
jgi:tetratricopeptide (TPR) repeat protein